MSDDDDYGFTYSDEDECDEEVDVKNGIITPKVRAGEGSIAVARDGEREEEMCPPTRASRRSFLRERGKVNRLTDAPNARRAQVCSRMGRENVGGVRGVISMEREKGEWGFKALKQIVKLLYVGGSREDVGEI